MTADLSRVATAAIRSATVLRTATPSLYTRTSSILSTRSSCGNPTSPTTLACSLQTLSLNGPREVQKRYQSSWTSPARSGKQNYAGDSKISKPTGPKSSQPPSSEPFQASSRSSELQLPEFDTDLPKPRSILDDLGQDDHDYTRHITFRDGELGSGKRGNRGDRLGEANQLTIKYPEIHCIARTGRTVQVAKGTDAARAVKLLEMQCSANRVRGDFNKQKFHERGGLRRKRLKSERWRRRFLKGFRATCQRVDELRRQGW